jgi:phage terminase Nu1 subunit (DNA packaging protein)
MSGEVIGFPRRSRDGEQWEAWVDEAIVARHFDVSSRTVRRWKADGCPSMLIGGLRKYRIGALESWHAERSTEPSWGR